MTSSLYSAADLVSFAGLLCLKTQRYVVIGFHLSKFDLGSIADFSNRAPTSAECTSL